MSTKKYTIPFEVRYSSDERLVLPAHLEFRRPLVSSLSNAISQGKGNQQKAATARARNLEKNAPKAGSQLKQNEAAKSIVCKVCFQTFSKS